MLVHVLPFWSLAVVCCRAVCAVCCQPDPHPQHCFKPNIFFLFFQVERASLVSSGWVMPGRQREQVSMATDVYRAPELRHRVGERHFSLWDGVRQLPRCHPAGRTGTRAAGRAVLLPPQAPASPRGPGCSFLSLQEPPDTLRTLIAFNCFRCSLGINCPWSKPN